ncbi:MAG TPA: PAS domain S-box protein [Dongiaceae bacterium]|nr:PAS domain S-box protein [Dongiaceae bacterium]
MSVAIIRRAALIFLPLVLVGACVIYLLYVGQSAAIRAEATAGERRVAIAAEQRVTQTLMMILADTLYLATQGALEDGLRAGEPGALRHLQREHLVFTRSRAIYDQIRLVDLNGREISRVDWNRGMPAIAPADHLRDLTDAPIFRDTMKLEQGQLAVTQLTLVDEALSIGGPKIPVISVAAPIFDPAGHRSGIVILDYQGQRLIDRIASLSGDTSVVWLTDDRGNWLIGPADKGGVTFRPALGVNGDGQDTFVTAFADAWRAIQEGVPSGIAETAAGRFNYAKINPDEYRPIALQSKDGQVVAGPSWIAIVHTSRDVIWAHGAELRRYLAAAWAVLLLLLAGIAFGLARHQVQRHESEARLRANEARMRDLLESAPDGVIIVNADGHIQLVNAQVERLFGYPRHELIGRSIDMLVPHELCNTQQDHRAGYLGAARTRQMGPGLDLCGVRRDGSEFPISVSLSPTATGAETTIFCDIRDMTAQRMTEQKIQDLNRRLLRDNMELESLNRELEAFSYSVSHDLRAPLRAIEGFSQALLEDAGDRLDHDSRSHLDRVRSAARRMEVLIADLLKLASVSRLDLNKDFVDLTALAREIVRDLAVSDPGRSTEIDVAPGLRASADPRLLRIALENLLSNAWKFTAKSAPATISVGQVMTGAGPAFFIRDNGVGFDMAQSARLFRPFQRLHDGQFPGTGIGLATTQRVIRRHGGEIWAKSQRGDGATFFFTLN